MRYFNFLDSWLDSVAQPPAHLVSQADKQHARLLSGLAFTITVLVLLQNITIWDRYSPNQALFWAFWGLFVFALMVYVMSRTKYTHQVSILFVSGLALLILLITTLETIEQTLLTPMLWMIFPILLAWLLEGTREVLTITAVTIISLLIIYFTNPELKDAMPGMLIGILLATTALLTIHIQYRKETIAIERQYTANLLHANQKLETLLTQTNKQLQNEVEERIRLDTALQEAQHIKTVGLMAGVLAHDFNNFLSAILLETGAIQGMLEDDNIVQKHLWRVSESAERATLLSAKLLTYAKGSQPFEIKAFDLGEEVRELCQILHVKDYATIVVNIPAETTHPIIGNQLDIQQLLMNFIINAGEAIPQSGGKIFVSVREIEVEPDDVDDYLLNLQPKPGRYIQLQVKDTGRGMDEITKKQIFEPFFTTKTDKKAGRGLGLASALGIVRSHDGALRVDSAKGRGTTFSVLFPLADTMQQ